MRNKLFIPFILVIVLLVISFSINMKYYANSKKQEIGTNNFEDIVADESDDNTRINKLEGIWKNDNQIVAFCDDGFVYYIRLSDQPLGDIKPEQKYIVSCRRGHLDENNTLIFTEKSDFDSMNSKYTFSVNDLAFSEFSYIGHSVNRVSSEILFAEGGNYLQTTEYDYLFNTDYVPVEPCSWKYIDYYLYVLNSNREVICKISKLSNNSLTFDESGNYYNLYSIDDEAYGILKETQASNPSMEICLALNDTVFYSCVINELLSGSPFLNELKINVNDIPEGYGLIFDNIK